MWQSGFWDSLARTGSLKPAMIGAVSAGATVACIALSGKSEEGFAYFKQITRTNQKNIYLSNLFSSRPVFPHYRMYRNAILEIIDNQALKRLQEGPDVRILIAKPPFWLGPVSATLVGLAVYSLEKKIFYPMHPVFASKIGFRPVVVSVRECSTPEELAELLLQSSCTPPFVPVMWRNNHPTLDGGMIDNVPVSILADQQGDMLVLLSRQYPKEKIPDIPGRTYIQPSEPIKIDKWDYTNPAGLQDAYDLGIKDGQAFLQHNG
ncbi:patatin-like phospholipase family protein [bacterium]|nr:patatin-like phospholipase family protein [bacterium]